MKLEVILDEFAYLDNPRKWDNKQAKRSLRIGKETQMIEAALKHANCVLINYAGQKDTPTGGVFYLQVLAVYDRSFDNISKGVALSLDLRYNSTHDAVSISGCGFNKREHLKEMLVQKYGEQWSEKILTR